MTKRWRRLVGAVAIIAVLLLAALAVINIWQVHQVHGVVLSNGKPLPGATVRIKASKFVTITDANGRFNLGDFPSRFGMQVTAWADGYYVTGETAYPWTKDLAFQMQPYTTTDNQSYTWIAPKVEGRPFAEDLLIRAGLPLAAKASIRRAFLPLASRFTLGCADCHGTIIYQQYADSAHARGTQNVIFATTYNGTDINGNKSQLTRYGNSRDYGSFPLRPDSNQPWYGPGFKLDFPDQAGNCASCHMPSEAIAAPLNTDINQIPKTAIQGINCDFCHKISGVRINPATGSPFENTPGVLSTQLRRPAGEPQVFFGPLDDVDVGPDTYLPLEKESVICSPCHSASFWGTTVYQSYAEWLASPYPKEGKTCQTCHMKPDGVTDNFAPAHGGQSRDPQTVFTHNFPGAGDDILLKNTANVSVTASRQGNSITVDVGVTNVNAGHDIPTDSPMRNIILLVNATDASGKVLEYTGNQTVPDWGGKGTDVRDFAGHPGKGYAKILEEVWTEVSPTIAYWRQTTIKSDNRIPARGTDVSHYEFQTSSPGPVHIDVKLVYRRAFLELAEVKKWDIPDIEMSYQSVVVP